MGKIYTFNEIRNGLVPTRDDFALAKSQTLNVLSEMQAHGEVTGAMVFGSVAKGTPSERSDFDLLVITDKERPLINMRDVFDSVYQNTRVAVEPIVIPKSLAEKGFHTMDASFFIHFQHAPMEGNIVGVNPLDIMIPFPLSLEKVHEQYLIQKLRRLREGIFTQSEADEHRVLQRALEAPVNTGRRTLQALTALGAVNASLPDDGKTQVKATFRDVFANTSIGDGFNRLIAKDEAYTELLRDALSKNVSQDEYQGKLQILTEEAIPEAVEWVSEISERYIHALEGNRIGVEGKPSFSKEH